ncbi:MAG: peptidoglycan-binding protein [Clostridia bacterium]|nr:peptidoglycan-binding protein [Clostridia bacterium]
MSGIERTPEYDSEPEAAPQIADRVAIPEFITVHLGAPSQNAENVRVPFQDYIKNVASSEIYPTWNEEALRANIIAIVSLTLNRIFTEWYPSRGYDFDITASTQFDQSFVKGRNYFDNISSIVDDLFDTYITRQDVISPLFAAYCDGRRTSCNGMSQWGSENLAREGASALNILRNYYGNNIELQTATEIANTASYPGYPLSLGSEGFEVEEIRRQLYRIADNYPLIPKINPALRVFDSALDSAVRTFQEIFGLTVDGIVGKATWYRISYVYASVTKLAELAGEGETGGLPEEVPTETVSAGDSGSSVARLQFLLGYIGLFYPEIQSPALDGIFGSGTEQAVREFQQYFGLPVTGIVTAADWQKLYDVYNELLETITPTLGEQSYPGRPLTVGSRGENVRLMQSYLNTISDVYNTIPKIDADGIYGNATAEAVRAFQRRFYLDITGTIDAPTWGQIVEVYNFITRQE